MFTTTRTSGLFLSRGGSSSRRLLMVAATGPILLASGYVLTGLLPESPLWNAAFRVLPAGILLLAVRPACPPPQWMWRSLILGALNFGGFFAAQAFALHRLPGGVTATIAALQAVLVPIGARPVLGERLHWSQVYAAAAGVAGMAFLVMRGTERLDPRGVAAAIVLAVCTAAGMLLTRRWGLPRGVVPTTATAWQMLSGGLLLLPPAVIIEGAPPQMTLAGWSVTAWLAVAATALAFSAMFGALHRGLPATSLSRLMLLCPLAATAGGWLLYRQTLSPLQLVGASMVLASVVAVAVDRHRHPRGPSAESAPVAVASKAAVRSCPHPSRHDL